MAKQLPSIRSGVLLITLLAIFGGLLVPRELIQSNIALFAVVLILGGIPHGASDYLIFRQLMTQQNSGRNKLTFAAFYLFIVLAYGALWWFSPLAAFGLFIVLSFYHFGQSNWEYIRFDSMLWQNLTYLLWGAFVVMFPVLLYHEQATVIIFEITGTKLTLESFRWPVMFILFMFNVLNSILLWESGHIDQSLFRKELLHLFILSALFLTTPLLIGFGIYFVFWHSLGTIFDQLAILRQRKADYSMSKYLRQLMPFSIMAFIGLGLFYWILGDRMDYGLNLGALFLFISIITVPHSILMDRFYLIRNDG